MPGPNANVLAPNGQALDQSASYKLTLGGGALNPSLAGYFTGSETLTARLWPGGTYATVATLAATWATVDAKGVTLVGNPASQDRPVLDLAVSKAAIAGLSPRTYWVEVLSDAGTDDLLLFAGTLRLLPAPGSTPIPRTYCDLAAMEAECAWIGAVEALKDRRAAGFVPECDQAARWAEEQAIGRLRRDYGDQLRAHGPIAYVAPIVPTTGIDGGPEYGSSSIEDTAYRAAESAFDAMLDSVGLMTNAPGDRGSLKRMTACRAIYLALRDQNGKSQDETSYQAEAERYRREAEMMLMSIVFRIDSDGDGVADYRLSL